MSHTKSTPQLSKIARRMYGKFVPRVRGEHEALPALVQERERQFQERIHQLNTALSASRVCNAAMQHTTYRTGDGEVIQQVRPGSMRAYGLPSRGIKA